MQNEKYFSHDANAHQDPKILALRAVYGWEGYGMFWVFVEMMRQQEDYKLPLGKYGWNMYAVALGKTPEEIEKFITDCINEFHLFETDGEYFWSNSLRERMKKMEEEIEKRVQKAKKAAQSRWEKKQKSPKENATAMQENEVSNADVLSKQCLSNAQAMHKKCSSNANAMQNKINKNKIKENIYNNNNQVWEKSHDESSKNDSNEQSENNNIDNEILFEEVKEDKKQKTKKKKQEPPSSLKKVADYLRATFDKKLANSLMARLMKAKKNQFNDVFEFLDYILFVKQKIGVKDVHKWLKSAPDPGAVLFFWLNAKDLWNDFREWEAEQIRKEGKDVLGYLKKVGEVQKYAYD